MQLQKDESIRVRNGQPHLCKNGTTRVFANMTQAENAASRVGGEAYQSRLSMRFLVRLSEDAMFEYHRDLEKMVAARTIATLLDAGYTISVNDGEAITVTDSTDPKAIFDAMFTTDEDYLIAQSREAGNRGWVRFIYGNAPSEVINDYTTNLEKVLKPIDALTDELSEQGA